MMNRTFPFAILLQTFLVFFVSCNKNPTLPIEDPLIPLINIGEVSNGGIVAYVDSTGQHGFVVTPHNLGTAVWGCFGVELLGANGLSLGTGSQNTLDITSNCGDTLNAAYLCNNLELNGFDDWYLPSVDELVLMYNNKSLLGNFENDIFGYNTYWSSSEYDSGIAWVVHFSGMGAGADDGDKDNLYNVRAIRNF